MMKKIMMYSVVVLVISVITVVGLSSFTSQMVNLPEVEAHVHIHSSCQGKHCSYTVGCDCSGFSPKTNGKEWEKSYCKRCGHHKKYHK